MQLKQINTDGVNWHFLDQGVCGEGDFPLLLVHGFPLDHTMWQHQVDSFSTRTRVICPDLPGFGNSRVLGDVAEHSMEWFARQLSEFLVALELETPVDYCGLSMGGYIGWQFWRNHRNQLRKLIACDTRVIADPPEVARGRRMMARTIANDGSKSLANGGFIENLFGPATLSGDSPVIEQTRQVIARTKPSSIAAAQLGMASRPDVTTWLVEFDMPTLLVVGSDDAISPVDEMNAIAQKIPRAKFVEIACAGHMSPLEQPEQFNKGLVSFLRH